MRYLYYSTSYYRLITLKRECIFVHIKQRSAGYVLYRASSYFLVLYLHVEVLQYQEC